VSFKRTILFSQEIVSGIPSLSEENAYGFYSTIAT